VYLETPPRVAAILIEKGGHTKERKAPAKSLKYLTQLKDWRLAIQEVPVTQTNGLEDIALICHKITNYQMQNSSMWTSWRSQHAKNIFLILFSDF
jgi:hypothetical protein